MFDFQAWAKKFLKQMPEPMDHELSRIFLNLSLSDGTELPQPIKDQFLYKVIDKRAEYLGLVLTDQAKAFLMFLSKSPGTAVMYLYAFYSRYNEEILINMHRIASVFPMGFPSEESLAEMWDEQKGHRHGENVDNCLDHLKI